MLDELKDREARGYTFEAADASLELMMRRAAGWEQPFFAVESFRVHVEQRADEDEDALAEATVKVRHEGHASHRVGRGARARGRAGQRAAQGAGERVSGARADVLEDYRVRVLDETHGTGAVVRVLLDTSNGEREWTTVGVSENIIEASWEALTDAYTSVCSTRARPPRTDHMTAIRAATVRDARAIAEVHVASWRWAYRDTFPAAALEGLDVEERARTWSEQARRRRPDDGDRRGG